MEPPDDSSCQCLTLTDVSVWDLRLKADMHIVSLGEPRYYQCPQFSAGDLTAKDGRQQKCWGTPERGARAA